ncbi:MAG: hypothetical protein Q9227_007723 [Pyrenula ochraceoflavens]
MRFKSQIRNVTTFAKFCASLASLGQIAWLRLSDDNVQFTIIPEKGSQVWSQLSPDIVFESILIQSNEPGNVINLEVPIAALHRALRSAIGATSAQLRLTKKDNVPILSLTIVTNTFISGNSVSALGTTASTITDEYGTFELPPDESFDFDLGGGPPRERETTITQDVPVKVLAKHTVDGLHEPRCREPDVHIILPNLLQVKSISERFTRLSLSSKTTSSTNVVPKLELSANMHGSFKISIKTDALSISSAWTGLINPELDPSHVSQGSQGIRDHPSTRMRMLGGENGNAEEGWAKVRIDGKDWSKVLSVGRLGGRVIACFIDETALILYVYLQNEDDSEESCLTYYINSYSL